MSIPRKTVFLWVWKRDLNLYVRSWLTILLKFTREKVFGSMIFWEKKIFTITQVFREVYIVLCCREKWKSPNSPSTWRRRRRRRCLGARSFRQSWRVVRWASFPSSASTSSILQSTGPFGTVSPSIVNPNESLSSLKTCPFLISTPKPNRIVPRTIGMSPRGFWRPTGCRRYTHNLGGKKNGGFPKQILST